MGDLFQTLLSQKEDMSKVLLTKQTEDMMVLSIKSCNVSEEKEKCWRLALNDPERTRQIVGLIVSLLGCSSDKTKVVWTTLAKALPEKQSEVKKCRTLLEFAKEQLNAEAQHDEWAIAVMASFVQAFCLHEGAVRAIQKFHDKAVSGLVREKRFPKCKEASLARLEEDATLESENEESIEKSEETSYTEDERVERINGKQSTQDGHSRSNDSSTKDDTDEDMEEIPFQQEPQQSPFVLHVENCEVIAVVLASLEHGLLAVFKRHIDHLRSLDQAHQSIDTQNQNLGQYVGSVHDLVPQWNATLLTTEEIVYDRGGKENTLNDPNQHSAGMSTRRSETQAIPEEPNDDPETNKQASPEEQNDDPEKKEMEKGENGKIWSSHTTTLMSKILQSRLKAELPLLVLNFLEFLGTESKERNIQFLTRFGLGLTAKGGGVAHAP